MAPTNTLNLAAMLQSLAAQAGATPSTAPPSAGPDPREAILAKLLEIISQPTQVPVPEEPRLHEKLGAGFADALIAASRPRLPVRQPYGDRLRVRGAQREEALRRNAMEQGRARREAATTEAQIRMAGVEREETQERERQKIIREAHADARKRRHAFDLAKLREIGANQRAQLQRETQLQIEKIRQSKKEDPVIANNDDVRARLGTALLAQLASYRSGEATDIDALQREFMLLARTQFTGDEQTREAYMAEAALLFEEVFGDLRKQAAETGAPRPFTGAGGMVRLGAAAAGPILNTPIADLFNQIVYGGAGKAEATPYAKSRAEGRR
jgi:hypothetical protein